MIKIIGSSDIGQVRQSNQDAYAYGVVSDHTAFAVVCDGMGGENGGGVASLTAIQQIEQILHRDLHDDLRDTSVKSLLSSCVSVANAVVYSKACADEDLKGMGTTIVACILKESTLYVAAAGDSRAYLIADTVAQITKDHTIVQILLDNGEITEEEAMIHPKRHYITRALGIGNTLEVDYYEIPFSSGTVLLCTDGLYNYIYDDELRQLVGQSITTDNVDLLIDAANRAGGGDNITAVILTKDA